MMRVLLSMIVSLLLAVPVSAQEADTYSTARVQRILSVEDTSADSLPRTTQNVELRIESGPNAGQIVKVEHHVLNNRTDQLLSPGQRVVTETLQPLSGTERIFIREFYRLPSIAWIAAGFFVLAFVLGGRTGFKTSLGLVASIAVLTLFVVPRIIAGDDPMLVCATGSGVIASTSLFLAHGFHRRTTIALLSTLLTLGLSIAMAMFAVRFTALFGTGSEESMFLQLGPLQSVNLRGLLLGGIVIGTLGVLDDVTTAQTAAVDELHKANPRMPRSQLHAAALSIGREHIASLINTLALAYAGASLPLLLLFTLNTTTPWWVILNGEFLAEEIIRTLIGSATLLLAVPVSTHIAVWLIHGRPLTAGHAGSHRHVH